MEKLTGSMLTLAQPKSGSGVPCNIKCQNRGRVSPDEYQQQAAAEVTINELEEKRNELNALERKTHDLLERRLQDTRAKLDAAKAQGAEQSKKLKIWLDMIPSTIK
jgi:hypothetical protein